MRRLIDPPPAANCHRCAGRLTLKRVDHSRITLGINGNVFECGVCGAERSYVSHVDLYAARSPVLRRAERLARSA
jgi:hypothetical protein